MKYFLIQTRPSSKFETWAFPINDSRKLNALYLKLRTLYRHDIPRDGNFYRVLDLPQNLFTQWEWEIVSKMENFRLLNMSIMTQWEWDLVKVINALGIRREVRAILQQYINQRHV